jgi:hypothetical protein
MNKGKEVEKNDRKMYLTTKKFILHHFYTNRQSLSILEGLTDNE